MMNGFIIGLALMMVGNGASIDDKRYELIMELRQWIQEEIVGGDVYDEVKVMEIGSSNGSHTFEIVYGTDPDKNFGFYTGRATIVVTEDSVIESYEEYSAHGYIVKDSNVYDLEKYYDYWID